MGSERYSDGEIIVNEIYFVDYNIYLFLGYRVLLSLLVVIFILKGM